MIVRKIDLKTQYKLLDKLDSELDDLKEDLVKVQDGWNVDGITEPSYMEDIIKEKRKEIDTEEDKLAQMEAAYNGIEIIQPKPWEKQRVEPKLVSFCGAV